MEEQLPRREKGNEFILPREGPTSRWRGRLIIIVLVLCIGVALAFLARYSPRVTEYLRRSVGYDVDRDRVIALALQSLRNAQQSHYKLELSVESQPRETMQDEEIARGITVDEEQQNNVWSRFPREIAMHASLDGKIAQEEQGQLYELKSTIELGDSLLAAAFDMRQVGKNYFIRTIKAPSLSFFDLASLKHTWVRIEPQDQFSFALGDLLFGSQDFALSGKTVSRTLSRIAEQVSDQVPISIREELPPYQKYDRYKLDAAPEFVSFLLGDNNSDSVGSNTSNFFGIMSYSDLVSLYERNRDQISVEAWIEKAERKLHKVELSFLLIPPATLPRLSGVQYHLATSITIGPDQGEAQDHILPTSSVSLDEAMATLTGQPLAVIQVGKQVRNVTVIRQALSLYNARSGSYPDSLEDLLQTVSDVHEKREETGEETSNSALEYRLQYLINQNSPFLRVVPLDVFSKKPVHYSKNEDSYLLEYTLVFPEGLPNTDEFVNGKNTATPDGLSLKPSRTP